MRSYVLTLLFIAGCAFPGNRQLVADKLHRQVVQAYNSIKNNEKLVLRYNPAPCKCSPFEVKTEKGWVRVVIKLDKNVKIKGAVEQGEKALKKGKIYQFEVKARVRGLDRCACKIDCIEVELK